MKVMVVYDSVFGNTEKIALGMRGASVPDTVFEARRATGVVYGQLEDVDVLIVGSPTRAFRPTKNIITFLKSIPKKKLDGKGVAAFDTRIEAAATSSSALRFLMNLFGYAADPILQKLVKKGGTPLADPEGFIVEGSEGPLGKGEEERAVEWAGGIAEKARSR
ncbi:MAG: flavodoxin family protein [Spirochaetales bacterium]|nr:flavodoxin family protein [Spirochaetales bacterium]